MKFYVYICTIVVLVAFGQADQGKVLADDTVTISVAEYDLGIETKAKEKKKVVAPEGKAETLVVVSAPWCTWCQVMKPGLNIMKREGYDVKVYNIEDPKQLAEMNKLYPQLKKKRDGYNVPGSYSVLPTSFYMRDGKITKTQTGFKPPAAMRKHLWKPEKPKSEIRGILPWNR